MRDDDHRSALRDATDVVVDYRFAVRIERAGRLVEDENARVEDQRARDGEALALAAGKIRRAFVDVCFVAARQTIYEFLRARQTRRAHHLVESRVRLCGRDILANSSAEQEVFLQHHAEISPQVRNIVFADVHAVDLDKPFVVRVQTLQQTGDRRFARSRAADDAERPAYGNLEIHPIESVAVCALIFEPDSRKFDMALQRAANAMPSPPFLLRLRRQLADDSASLMRASSYCVISCAICISGP